MIFICVETVYIYKLIDPRDNNVKYIGKTFNLKKRLSEHISEAKTRKGMKTKKENWILKLISLGLKPIINLIAEVPTTEYEYWETFYIKKHKDEFEVKLLNWDENGAGMKNKLKSFSQKGLRNRKIIQYDLNGRQITTFKSLREAERLTGINHGNISKVCNKIYKHSGGYIFRYFDTEEKVNPIKNPNGQQKPVIMIDGNETKEFSSISEASRITQIHARSISKCCNGKLKSTNNKIFKFKTNEQSD